MHKNKFLLMALITLFGLQPSIAQVSPESSRYPDYQQFLSNLKFSPSASRTPADMLKGLLDSAVLLSDESSPVGHTIVTVKANKKTLADEEIYASRKNSVLMVGKLKKATGGPASVSFDLTGTAFAITTDGICVTNYHVLQSLIVKDMQAMANDSAYFIITHDRHVYIIDQLLAYSRNNDLAVFRVNTEGARLQPLPLGKPAPVGAAVYCISHPGGYFYSFSKGIVARNITIPNQRIVTGHNPKGRLPIRMEITAEYGVGSSGGPILDKYGNLAGIISSTTPLGTMVRDETGNMTRHQQMAIKDALPVDALLDLLGMNTPMR